MSAWLRSWDFVMNPPTIQMFLMSSIFKFLCIIWTLFTSQEYVPFSTADTMLLSHTLPAPPTCSLWKYYEEQPEDPGQWGLSSDTMHSWELLPKLNLNKVLVLTHAMKSPSQATKVSQPPRIQQTISSCMLRLISRTVVSIDCSLSLKLGLFSCYEIYEIKYKLQNV